MSIEEFAQRVFEDRKIAFAKKGYDCLDVDNECATIVVPGTKYSKVDVGPRNSWSGRFMIDKEGNIFGIKAYGSVNKRKWYGTLDTANEWYWGEYYPIHK